MVSLDPAGDPLGDEAMRLCAAAGATTLRLPGAGARRPAAGADHDAAGRRRARRPGSRWPPGHDVDKPDLDRRLLRDREERAVSVRLGVVGCGSVFWTPYMSLIERLRGQGRVEVTAVYDADPEKRRTARPSGSTCAADLPATPTSASTRTSTRCSCSRACPSTAGSRARRSRPASTCSSRSRWRPRWRRPRRCSRPPRPRPATCSAPRTSCSRPTYRAMHARVLAGEIGGLLTRAGALRLGRARTGAAGSTSRAAARCSTSASTTSPACAASSARRGA